MPEFDAVEAKILRGAVSRFREAMEIELADPIRTQLRDYRPPELTELEQELALVGRQLENGEPPFKAHHIHARAREPGQEPRQGAGQGPRGLVRGRAVPR